MLIGVLVLLPYSIWRKIKGRSFGFELPLTGLLLGGGFICYALSFLLTDVVRALILFYMTPVWTTIFEILFLKKNQVGNEQYLLLLHLEGCG
jgi:drug/metabolite transporter (DMT)-like permease